MAVSKLVFSDAFLKKLIIFSFLLLVVNSLWAVDKYTANGGDWNSASTWSPSGIPQPGDNIIIQHNILINNGGLSFSSGTITIRPNIQISPNGTLTVNGTANLILEENAKLIVNSGGALLGDQANVTLKQGALFTINGGTTVNGTAYVKVESGATLYPNSPGLLLTGNGTIDVYGTVSNINSSFAISDNGNLIVRENGKVHSNSSLALTGNANIQLDGLLTMSGAITGTPNTVISGTGDLTTCCAINSDGTIFGMKPFHCSNGCSNPTCVGSGGSITNSNPSICSGASYVIQSTGNPTLVGTLVYKWQYSTDWGNNWTDIANSNSATYTITPTGSNILYRRAVKTLSCKAGTYKYSNNFQYGLQAAITSGTIGGAGSICSGSSQTLTNVSSATGNNLSYLWQSSTDNTNWTNISTATSAIYTATPSVTTYYRRSVTSSNCSSSYAYSNSVLVTVNSGTNTWIGNTSTDWHTPSNWSCGIVPSLSTNAIITDVTNDPVIALSANAKDITLSSGATLTINGSNNLSVAGDFTNEGATLNTSEGTVSFIGEVSQKVNGTTTFKHLTLDNSAGLVFETGTQTVLGKIELLNGTIQTNNNLILDLTNDGMIAGPSAASGSEGISGNITIKRTMSAVGPNTFHYISTPLGSGTIADFNDDQNFINSGYASYYYYDETVRNADKNIGFLPYRNTSGSIGGASMKGFALYQKNTSTEFDVTGSYNHYAAYNNVPLSFTRYTTGSVDESISQEADGWHLIGNPYPGPLDWDTILKNSTNIGTAFYVYNNATGSIGVYGGNGAYVNVTSKYIPAMQSFFVQTYSEGASISINNESRAVENPTSPSFYRLVLPAMLKLTLTDDLQKDESIVRFNDESIFGFDAKYDAVKMYNDGNIVSLYSKIDEIAYAINTIPSMYLDSKEILIGLKNGKDKIYTLKFDGIESIDSELSILLIDQLTNEIYNLRSISTISFENNNSFAGERFKLIFSEPLITHNLNSQENNVRIFSTDQFIIAENLGDTGKIQEVFVYDIVGNEIGSATVRNTSRIEIPVQKEGVYIVKVSVGNEVITQKIFKK